jgi:hypothetical protein
VRNQSSGLAHVADSRIDYPSASIYRSNSPESGAIS